MDDDGNCIVAGCMGGNEVLLNGWMFCCAHSREHCYVCCRDHRMTNNVQFEDELTEQQYELLTDYGTEDLADRKPLCAENLWKKLPGNKTACRSHGKVGCGQCFDFKGMVLSQIPPKLPAGSPAAVGGTATGTTAAQSALNVADSSTVPSVQHPAATAEAGARKCWGCRVASSPSVKLRKCSACMRARYCSAACQRQHFPEHKAQCKQWRHE